MFPIVAQLAYEQKNRMHINNCRLRDTMNPFDIPDERFRELYRMPAVLAQEFIEELKQADLELDHDDIPFHLQFVAVLYFYASGCYQRRTGTNAYAPMSQSTMSRCIKKVSAAIVDNLRCKYVNFPKNDVEMQRLKDRFMETDDFPGVIGLIDGTHIAMAALGKNIESGYVNRKGFHSLNVQIICDSDLRILNSNARYPGSTHDSYIWKNSFAFTYLEEYYERNPDANNWLLGDSGYPLQPWLMTPIPRTESPRQELYNRKHAQTRSKVERCIGLLKTTFRCLLGERKLRYDHDSVANIFYACCILHNFLLDNNYINNVEVIENNVPVTPFRERARQEYYNAGLEKRNVLIQLL